MDTQIFMPCTKTKDIFEVTNEDINRRPDLSNFKSDRTLPARRITKMIGTMKDKLSGKIMVKNVGLRPKKYSSLQDDASGDKTAKGTKKCNKMKT